MTEKGQPGLIKDPLILAGNFLHLIMKNSITFSQSLFYIHILKSMYFFVIQFNFVTLFYIMHQKLLRTN